MQLFRQAYPGVLSIIPSAKQNGKPWMGMRKQFWPKQKPARSGPFLRISVIKMSEQIKYPEEVRKDQIERQLHCRVSLEMVKVNIKKQNVCCHEDCRERIFDRCN